VRNTRMGLEEAAAFAADPARSARRTYHNPLVVLVAVVADRRLLLPWERDPRPARFRRSLGQEAFAQLIARGEHAEIGARRPAEAVVIYAQTLAAARDRSQAGYARLLRARAALAAGRRDEALHDYDGLLRSGRDIVDEHGVPLALYAATRFLDAGGRREAIAAAMRGALDGAEWLSPAALYLLRSLCDSLPSDADSSGAGGRRDLARAITARLMRTEQAIALQRDFPQLGLGDGSAAPRAGEARWIAYGSPAWLVGRAATGGAADVVMAVRADTLFAEAADAVLGPSAASVELAVAAGDEANGEPLGAAFPGLGVRFNSAAAAGVPGWDLRRSFYVVTLGLVLSVTLFGAYILTRDVRRELRLAELRSRFVSAVSHELKTPLTAIRMYAETLQLARAQDPATQTEYLETIVNESERLTRLLNNVLDYSKIERGGKQYRRAPDDLADIVAASARAMRYPLEQQRFTLNVEVEDGLPPAAVDRDAIEQAILNLLANAVKYSGESRVIDLRLRRADGRAVIEVADRGVGIAPEEQRRIFEEFYRVPAKENEGIPGTGLGLTLVRHVAEGHGGRVTVESAPGRGSTFAIHLPLEGGDA
jgi:signal transduction histidine kinase